MSKTSLYIPCILFSGLLLLLIASCGTKNINTKTGEEGPSSYKFYGNFCGSGHPFVSATSANEELQLLAAIEPIDLIDKACKIHDMCYALYGTSNVECDINFLKNINIANKHIPYKKYGSKKKKNIKCERVVDNIRGMMSLKTHFYASRTQKKDIPRGGFKDPITEIPVRAVFEPLFNLLELMGKEGVCTDVKHFGVKMHGEDIIHDYL